MTKLRVFLVDDHAVVREGLKVLINAQAGMEVVGEAADGQAALDAALKLHPDIVVMDICMPGWSAAMATQQTVKMCPSVKVLVLTAQEDRGYLRQLLEAGASGYVLKRGAAEALVHAIRAIAGGGMYVDPSLAGKFITSIVRKGANIALDELSSREQEVVRLVAEGHSNKQIAARLSLSIKTVETYKARSLEKLGLHSRADLVRYALHRGWLQAP